MKLKEYKEILEKAYKVTGPDNNFVNSCEDFLNTRGFLSQKQVEALQKVKPWKRDPGRSYYEEYHDPDGDLLGYGHDFDPLNE